MSECIDCILVSSTILIIRHWLFLSLRYGVLCLIVIVIVIVTDIYSHYVYTSLLCYPNNSFSIILLLSFLFHFSYEQPYHNPFPSSFFPLTYNLPEIKIKQIPSFSTFRIQQISPPTFRIQQSPPSTSPSTHHHQHPQLPLPYP